MYLSKGLVLNLYRPKFVKGSEGLVLGVSKGLVLSLYRPQLFEGLEGYRLRRNAEGQGHRGQGRSVPLPVSPQAHS
jgi:hypothetical protein